MKFRVGDSVRTMRIVGCYLHSKDCSYEPGNDYICACINRIRSNYDAVVSKIISIEFQPFYKLELYDGSFFFETSRNIIPISNIELLSRV